jgi:hypothetical protein
VCRSNMLMHLERRRGVDLSPLAKLGKVAGIGGIALGVLVLLLRPVIDRSGSLPQPMQGWLLLTIVAGTFGVGFLGMVLWWLGARSGTQRARTDGDYSEARNIDRKDPRRNNRIKMT